LTRLLCPIALHSFPTRRSSDLFAQSVAEVHGIAVQDPERARALVMALMLGKEGIDLVSQLTRQASGKGGTRASYWGELVTKSLRSEEHTSELQSRENLVCRLLL